METNLPAKFRLTRRIFAVIDLAGFAKAFQTETDERMAIFVDAYYAACEQTIPERGGTIIKFIGDGCLAVFPGENAVEAVQAIAELETAVVTLSKTYQIPIALGANVHMGSAIEGEFGSGSSRQVDIIGRAVNQTFLLGRGSGIRLSEPVYRALPSGARSPWKKHKPPAVYHADNAVGIYEGGGKDPLSNALRW
jgi:class 3 adenylate cyclase